MHFGGQSLHKLVEAILELLRYPSLGNWLILQKLNPSVPLLSDHRRIIASVVKQSTRHAEPLHTLLAVPILTVSALLSLEACYDRPRGRNLDSSRRVWRQNPYDG